ncbi:MAG: hypothetical protein NVSMB57_03950 [Actinomycetota bacterium]
MVRFNVVPNGSQVWSETRSSLHPIKGEARGLGGFVEVGVKGDELDLSEPPKARIELPIESMMSGNALYDSEMKRRVDARRFPTIVGEVREVEALGPRGRYWLRGDLTFHGVTKSVEGEVTAAFPDSKTLVIEGEQIFDIREFGVDPPKILMLKVHPEVKIRLKLVAERAG